MEGLLAAIIVAIITTVVQLKIAKKDRVIREGERKDKFRLAALDKRLDVHQEAYYRWNKMLGLIHEDSKNKSVYIMECQEWYYKNCLYLDSESRLEFKMCINNIFDYKIFWSNWKQSQKNTKEHENANNELKFIFGRIQKAGEIIASGVDINFKSIKDFDDEEKKSDNLKKDINE